LIGIELAVVVLFWGLYLLLRSHREPVPNVLANEKAA
jgi:hypothetical protein